MQAPSSWCFRPVLLHPIPSAIPPGCRPLPGSLVLVPAGSLSPRRQPKVGGGAWQGVGEGGWWYLFVEEFPFPGLSWLPSSKSCRVGQCSESCVVCLSDVTLSTCHFASKHRLSSTLPVFTPEITTLCVTLRRGKLLQSLFSAGEACLNSHLYIYIFIYFFFPNGHLCKLYAVLPGAFHFIPLHLLFLPSQNRNSSTSFTRVPLGPCAREFLGAGCVAMRNGSNLFQGHDKSPRLELQQFCSLSSSSVVFPIAVCLFALLILK